MVKPLGERVLLQECGEKQRESGGIILPDSVLERQQQESKVVALGTAKDENGEVVDFAVSIGDVVITKKFSGTDVKYGDQQYKIVDQIEILAVLEN